MEGIFECLLFTGLAFVYLVFPTRKDKSERETRSSGLPALIVKCRSRPGFVPGHPLGNLPFFVEGGGEVPLFYFFSPDSAHRLVDPPGLEARMSRASP